MFSRKPDSESRPPISREVVTQLADAVGKGPQLQLAEANVSALRSRRDALKTEQQGLIRDYHAAGHAGTKQQRERIAGLDADIRAAESQINAARPKVSELRRARADRVNDALMSIQKECAARIVAAYEEITAATDVLIACNEEIRKAGNPDRPHLNHVAGVTLIRHARWLLR